MNDLNGTALAALAAALAPHIAAELAKLNTGGAPVMQNGGGFGASAALGAQNTGQQQAQMQQANTAQQAGGMFGAAAGTGQQQAVTVTPDMIQTLITPLVQNEQIKQALTQQMQQMGINNLPDARPEQLAELYQRFQNVEQQARAAGLIGGVAQSGAPSII